MSARIQDIEGLRLAFLGTGNIASAIIRGLIAAGLPPSSLIAADPDEQQLARIGDLGVQATNDNVEACARADVVLLCVKPGVVPDLARGLAPHLAVRKPLVISVAAGIPTRYLGLWLGGNLPLVRCMPNTPATIGQGASALLANGPITARHRTCAETILGAVGTCTWVESDDQIDVVTALSGSGPAYFFFLMEALEDAGVHLGLDRSVARALVRQTALGAAMLAGARDVAPADLRAEVTSRGGTTHAAISRIEELDFAALVDSAVARARARAAEMAESFR